MKVIRRYEYGRLLIGEENFTKKHWKAFVKLNTLHDGKYFEVLYNGIRFKHYVGVIQVDGLLVEINPKADKDDDDNRWKGILLKMLKACGRIKASSAGIAHVSRQNLNLLEVYFELYLQEIDKLLRQGLIKQYRKNTTNVKSLKGKLEFAGNIRQNVVHKERFYTTHQVYDKDHKLHQILHVANTIVNHFVKGTHLGNLSNRVKLAFPEVKRVGVTKQLLYNVKLNRKSAHYSYALELARLIILNYSPDIKGGSEKMLSLLFDMNELWEEYVLVQLRKYADKHHPELQITGQETTSFIGYNYLKPDIVLKKGDETYIIDTKWKRPTNKSASVTDLRQMYTYARYWDARKVMLLYPGNNDNTEFREFITDDYSKDSEDVPQEIKHECKLGFVSVLSGQNNLDPDIGKNIWKAIQIVVNINKPV